ncbi:MAG: hypothetical protein SGI90_09000 [Candidatus Eisenbacteria bacterium]|nr:hypothetical protein [Candidatus Eisenbacteria bacterium]
MFSRRRSWIVAAAVSLLVAIVVTVSMMLGTDGQWSLPLDDSFIFFQYARQFASGHFFQYNGGDPPSGGATSVATLLIDALGWLLGFRGDGMVVFALLCGAIGLSLCLVAAWRLGIAMGMERPVWAAALVGLNGPVLWGLFAGMDLPLYLAGLLWTMTSWMEEAHRGPGRRRTLVWAGIAAASRPEGLSFGILVAVLLLLEHRGRSTHEDETGRTPPVLMLTPIAIGLLPMILLYLFTGRATPTSLAVKGVLSAPGMDAGTWIGGALEYFASILRDIYLGFEGADPVRLQANNASGVILYLAPLTLILWFIGLLPGVASELSRRRPGPFLLGGLAFLSAITVASLVVPRAYHWHRYLIPTFAMILPFAALGLERVCRGLARLAPEARPETMFRVVGFTWLILTLPGTLYFLLAFAQNSADIAFQQRALARWCRVNLPAEARLGVNDAGALRYDGIHPIVDFEGLVTPSLTDDRREGGGSLWEALERFPRDQLPTHLVLYPNWYDGAMLRPHRLIRQHRILRQTIAGGNPMNVYEADWSLLNSGDQVAESEVVGLVSTLHLVDRLDVADLANERQHHYVYRAVEGSYQGILELQPGGPDGRSIMDGGRLISGGESFNLSGLSPGQDALLVARSRNGFRLLIRVDGSDPVEWLEPGRGGPNWVESALTIPGELIRKPNVRLDIRLAEEHSVPWSSFHYWVYQ